MNNKLSITYLILIIASLFFACSGPVKGMIPVDVAEIKSVSMAVIEKLNEYDPDQYAALVQSIA